MGNNGGKDLVAQRGKACTSDGADTGVVGKVTTFLVGAQVSEASNGDDKGRVGE